MLAGEPDVLDVTGAVVESASTLQGLPACSPRENRPHGYEPVEQRLTLLVAPGGEASVTARHRTGEAAPWPDSDFRVAFTVRQPGVPERVVLPREPAWSGPTGVQIDLRTSPTTAPTGGGPRPTLPRGGALVVRGQTSPALARQLVVLSQSDPSTRGRAVPFAEVRTDASGAFRHAWRPSTPGYHEVWATYRSQQPGLVDDWSCPRAFDVADGPLVEPPPVPPPGQLVAATRRLRLTGSRTVRLSLRCLGLPDASPCAGSVALSHGGRRVASRRIRLAVGARRTLRLRVSARFARIVRRGARRAVLGIGADRRVVVVARRRR
jgi:hypothetical protein